MNFEFDNNDYLGRVKYNVALYCLHIGFRNMPKAYTYYIKNSKCFYQLNPLHFKT